MDITQKMLNFTHDRVGIAGDWHGTKTWAVQSIREFAEAGVRTVFQLGDFGLWGNNNGRKYLHAIEKVLKEENSYLFVTLGNHEDYTFLETFPKEKGMFGTRRKSDDSRIFFFDRGVRWVWNNHSFMSFGGANSIDRQWRTEFIDWWPQEQITDSDVFAAIQNQEKVDVMFTHDVPEGVNVFDGNRISPNYDMTSVLYAQESSKQLKKVHDVVQPKINFHGHYHVARDNADILRVAGEYEFYTTRTICLDRENTVSNHAILNTKTLDVTFA